MECREAVIQSQWGEQRKTEGSFPSLLLCLQQTLKLAQQGWMKYTEQSMTWWERMCCRFREEQLWKFWCISELFNHWDTFRKCLNSLHQRFWSSLPSHDALICVLPFSVPFLYNQMMDVLLLSEHWKFGYPYCLGLPFSENPNNWKGESLGSSTEKNQTGYNFSVHRIRSFMDPKSFNIRNI